MAKASSSIGPAAGSGAIEAQARTEALVEALARLEPIGVVVADQPMRRVEDRLPAAVVVDEDDAGRLRVRAAEAEDVLERRAAEAIDALVVVADHRHVAVRLGEEADDLPLGMVRVLELVDQDVPIAAALLLEDGRVLAQQARAGPPGRRSRADRSCA